MAEHEARRTLVKSPPELWAELSDSRSLARHLGELGEIRITRLEPETTVAWEGDRASGTVEIEPAGWGTRVTLRAHEAPDAAGEPPSDADPSGPESPGDADDAPLPPPIPLRPREPRQPAPPVLPPQPPLPPAARTQQSGSVRDVLTGVLDTLGGAAGNIRRRHAPEGP